MEVKLNDKPATEVDTKLGAQTPANVTTPPAPVITQGQSPEAPLAPVTAAGVAAQEAQGAPAAASPPAQRPRQIITMPSDEVGKMKRKAAADALLREARTHGYETVEEYRAAVAAFIAKDRAAHAARAAAPQGHPAGNAPVPQGAPSAQKPEGEQRPPAPEGATPRAMSSADQQRIEKLAQERAASEREVRRLRKEIEKQQGEALLKQSAMRAGIYDPDHAEFALHQLRKHLEVQSDEAMESFDPDVYFPSLRTKFPFLFAGGAPIIEHGSTTAGDGHKEGRDMGTSSGANPAGAAPGQPAPTPPSKEAQQGASAPKQLNALEMDDDTYNKFVRERGWTRPGGATSYPTPGPAGGGKG